MAISKGLGLSKLKETVKSGVKTAQDGLGSIDVDTLGKAVEGGLRNAKDSLAKIDVTEAIQGAKDLVETNAANVANAIKSVSGKSEEESVPSASRDAVTLLWCLASVDGAISQEERARVCELARALDEGYEDYAANLEIECSQRIEAASREFGRPFACKIEAQKIVEGMDVSPLEAKLVCWNLLAVAVSGGFGAEGLDFVRFVSEKMGVDVAVFEELRGYASTLVEIGEARAALRTSNRGYVEIEPFVHELEKRERTIVEAAQALVADR